MLKNFLQKKEFNQTLTKLDQVKEYIPAPDVLNFFSKLTEAYQESQISKLDYAKLEAQKEVVLMEMENKYALYHKVFDRIFDERKSVIDKSFEIIDKGMSTGDRELISLGLQNLSKVISSSPFANMQQLSNMLEEKKIIEI